MSSIQEVRFETGKSQVFMPMPAAQERGACGAGDSAMHAFTDLRANAIPATGPDTTIDQALGFLKTSGLQVLFVVDQRKQLLGSITRCDIQGEKPLRYMQSIGCTHTTCAWRDVRVADVMEPVSEWSMVNIEHLDQMTLGEVAAHLQHRSRQHLVVVDRAPGDSARRVCGLLSAARVEALLASAPVAH